MAASVELPNKTPATRRNNLRMEAPESLRVVFTMRAVEGLNPRNKGKFTRARGEKATERLFSEQASFLRKLAKRRLGARADMADHLGRREAAEPAARGKRRPLGEAIEKA